MSKRRKRILIILLGTLCILSIGFYYVVENVLPYSGIRPRRMIAAQQPEFANGYTPDIAGLPFERWKIKTNDSLLLDVYFLPIENPKRSIILLHGIADIKEHMYSIAQQFQTLECNVVLIDLRAHGQSEGLNCTFGYYEKFDIAALVDTMENHRVQHPIGLFGSSLGGAVALQAMAINPKIEFGIVESTFDQLDHVFAEYSKEIFGTPVPLISNHVLKESGRIAEFNPDDVSPVASSANIHVPILFVHGTNDEKIPMSMNKRNYEAVPGTNKQFIEVEGAGHANVHTVGGTKLMSDISQFLKQLN